MPHEVNILFFILSTIVFINLINALILMGNLFCNIYIFASGIRFERRIELFLICYYFKLFVVFHLFLIYKICQVFLVYFELVILLLCPLGLSMVVILEGIEVELLCSTEWSYVCHTWSSIYYETSVWQYWWVF